MGIRWIEYEAVEIDATDEDLSALASSVNDVASNDARDAAKYRLITSVWAKVPEGLGLMDAAEVVEVDGEPAAIQLIEQNEG